MATDGQFADISIRQTARPGADALADSLKAHYGARMADA
jgi:hypothetical protein